MTKRKKEKHGHPLSSIENDLIPTKHQDLASVALILIALLVFFWQVIFEGKIFLGGDKLASDSFRPYVHEANREGVFPLWIPFLFSGMPSHASLIGGASEKLFPLSDSSFRWWDLTGVIWRILVDTVKFLLPNHDVTIFVFYYFLFGVTLFLFMREKGLPCSSAIFTSLAGIFSTFIVIWIMIGHLSKIPSLIFFPLILLHVERLIRRARLLDMLLLPLWVHLLFLAQHIQLIFYFFFAIAIYLIYLFIRKLFDKNSIRPVLNTAGTLVVAIGLAFAMSGDRYLSVLEYNRYSTRGTGPILTTDEMKPAQEAGSTRPGPSSGLTYEYATNWSFSPQEVITFFIPSFYGYGIREYTLDNQVYTVPTYFGQMPFTDAPQYMGVITLVLAAIGIAYYRKDRFVQGLIIISVIALLISFGKNMSLLYDPMFYYFPFFNKFRVPSMILILVQLATVILAGFGVNALIHLRKNHLSRGWKKGFGYSLAGFGVLLIAGFILRGSLQESYFGLIASSGNRIALQLKDFLFDSMMTDWVVSCLIALATLGVSYAYLKGKVRHALWLGMLVLLVIFDLWRVDAVAMRPEPKQELERHFAIPEYVSFIRRDTTLYRVHLLRNNQPQTDNKLTYYRLQNIYGYHAAKLRVFQDLIDVAGINNKFLWNLLNMKYLISDQVYPDSSLHLVYNGETKVMVNSKHLPRAFFVSRYEVAEPLEIVRNIREGSFNPQDVAYVESDPGISVEPPGPEASVEIANYGIQDFKLRVIATGSNLLFLSEVYYPAGWHATVDGQPTTIYKTNYAFRSILVPAGEHIVDFTFEPRMFKAGKSVSLASNIIVLASLISVVGAQYMKRGKKQREEHSEQRA